MTNEILSRRTINSKHFHNPDGTFRAEIYPNPIHFEDIDGKLENIELNIIFEKNWEFEYALKRNTFRAYFNDVTDIENYTLAGFELINSNGVSRWINFKMFGAKPISNSQNENHFKYHSVFEGVDLEYIVTPEKLKENIIVHTEGSLKPFTFTLKIDEGLKMELQEDNSIYFFDVETKEKLWEIQAPFAVDSSEGDKLFTKTIQYTLGKQIYEGVEYDSITVEITDEEFLKSAVYPIEIDPTVTLNISSKDTHVNKHFPSSENGTSSIMAVGTYSTLTGNKADLQGYIDFNMPSLPLNAYIKQAQLTLFFEYLYSPYSASSFAFSIGINRVTTPWAETITWNTKPTSVADGDMHVRHEYNTNSYGYKEYNVTKIVQNWKDGLPFYGFHLWGTEGFDSSFYNGTNTGGYVGLSSRNATTSARHPKLVIEYGIKPTLISPNGGEVLDKLHTIAWTPAEMVSSFSNTEDFEDSNYFWPETRGFNYFTVSNRRVKSGSFSFDSGASRGHALVVSSKFTINIPNGGKNPTVTIDSTVDSEGNYDFFYIFVNNVEKVKISGLNQPWRTDTFSLNEGTNTVEFRYTKDANTSSGLDAGFVDNMKVTYEISDSENVRYNLQLSTDNANTWKSIIALTNPGVTSTNYDFSNEQSSSQCKLRIRGYDGTNYTPWDESDGVFTIKHRMSKIKIWDESQGKFIEIKKVEFYDELTQTWKAISPGFIDSLGNLKRLN